MDKEESAEKDNIDYRLKEIKFKKVNYKEE